MTQTYNADAIEVLTGLEPVRRRPGMYTDTTRPNHLGQEVIDNSVDEALAGHAKRIDVILHADGSVSVKDNGRGIAEEDRHKIFEPFRRAGKQDVAGEGMGLAYVQTLVRRHGGRIWYESRLDQGTTFSFTIAHDFTKGNVDV